ncbi:hypothetical protein RB195_003540 [Necator americanus]|uniref:Uncharacterized protein n=1 Tax=Necator americanus TaxID=51031 RepID=A0ABR1DP06_NECAM
MGPPEHIDRKGSEELRRADHTHDYVPIAGRGLLGTDVAQSAKGLGKLNLVLGAGEAQSKPFTYITCALVVYRFAPADTTKSSICPDRAQWSHSGFLPREGLEEHHIFL